MNHSLHFTSNGHGQLYAYCECSPERYTPVHEAMHGLMAWLKHVDESNAS